MGFIRKTSFRSIAGHIVVMLSFSLILSGFAAAFLQSRYHGYLEQPADTSSYWVTYFEFGSFRITEGTMLLLFAIAFGVVPTIVAVLRALTSRDPRFESLACFASFGLLLLIDIACNVFIAFTYLFTNWNSSAPF